jgi:glutamyl-tRNA synthetase
VPLEGKTVIFDEVLGETKVDNKQLDDFIIVRSDGNPIYNLSVVVDDHDMNVTHVIRGSEHLNNTYKQKLIYQALGWEVPKFAHLPVILAPQGQQGKLSKRHGSVTCEDYRNQGYLPEALFNYLLRLGWAHGDKEIILKEEAIELFDFKGVSKSPAHYDNKKLTAINAHYIREGDIKRIFNLTVPFIENLADFKLKDEQKELIYQGFASIKERANTLVDAASMCLFYIKDMAYDMDDKSKKVLNEGLENIKRLLPELEKIEWTHDNINDFFKQKAQELEIKMGKLVQPFRVAVTYSAISPPLFEAMEILGKKNAINRIKLFIS